MVKDVVCGMEVDPTDAPAQRDFQGKTYFFCAEECAERFDRNPQQFVKQADVA